MKKPIETILELKTTDNCQPHEIFYRYRVGSYTLWFTQHQDNGKTDQRQNLKGCIFQVHVALDDDVNAFPLRVSHTIGHNEGYPDVFEIDNRSVSSVQLKDYETFIEAMEYSKHCLGEIMNLFFLSDHHRLFTQRALLNVHKSDTENSQELGVNAWVDKSKEIISKIRESIASAGNSDIGSRTVEGQFLIDVLNCLNYFLRGKDRIATYASEVSQNNLVLKERLTTLQQQFKDLQDTNSLLDQARISLQVDYNAEVLKNQNLAKEIFSSIVAEELGHKLLDESSEFDSVSLKSLKAAAKKYDVTI